ncbi:MAG: ATP-binding protein [Anaerolineae bacterium]|nr:ATP-binding protein [Anaerolineae bacterium]MDH7474569.1 ATP-binding protein [Anaerolineae bacterium]
MSETRLLYDISQKLNSDLDLDRILADILALTVPSVDAQDGSIMIFDDTGQVAHQITIRKGLSGQQAQEETDRVLSGGLAGWVVAQRRGTIVNDTRHDERWLPFPDDGPQVGSAIAVPLMRRDKVVGVLTLIHPQPHHFDVDQLALLSSIANQAAVAVENARLFRVVQEERAKLQAVLNEAADVIMVTDEKGGVLLMNPAARLAFRGGAPLSAGTRLEDAVDNKKLVDLFRQAMKTGIPQEKEIPLPDGRTLFATLTPVRDVGWVAVMQDITYLKTLDQMKSDFVATVSHDLRSPLQMIYTYAGLLPEMGPMNEMQLEFVEGINQSVEKMSALITDLLDLAKIEAGMEMTVKVCQVDNLIRAALTETLQKAMAKSISIHTEIEAPLPLVAGDPTRLEQVMTNLLDNAIKYTPNGGRVTVAARSGDREIIVEVRDTGIGISAEDQAHIFEKFFRVKSPQTEGIEGTGLGLAIVRSIIERHGGRVWVHSRLGVGSTFGFALPITSGL